MRVGYTEEMIMNQDCPVTGWRRFRLEYGGHATECLAEGTVYIPPNLIHKSYEIMDKICALLSEDDVVPSPRISKSVPYGVFPG